MKSNDILGLNRNNCLDRVQLIGQRIEANNEHSVITESHSSNSCMETKAFAYMANTPEEMARILEEQSRVQQAQHNMLQDLQESINNLKKMIALLLDKQKRKPKNSKTGASSSKNKGKEEGENSTS